MIAWRTALALPLALLAVACTDDAYVVGAVCAALATCPAAGAGGAGGQGGAGGTAMAGLGGAGTAAAAGFTLDFDGSGVERLPQQLLGVEPSHFLLAPDATRSRWDARVGVGFDVTAASALTLAEASPFADPGTLLSHAGASPFNAASDWVDASAGAVALEAVFRAAPSAILLAQGDAAAGLELGLDASGRLDLRLAAGADELLVSSQPLVADAWHHCLALLDSGQAVAQLFCNGQAGAASNLPAGFALGPSAAPVTLGSDNPARVYWAALARWQAATWGPRGAWIDVARERFARLVGTYATGASEPLPFADVRASGAYIDMTPAEAPEQRRLHAVGEHWPRIVCRPTTDAPRTCGLLVEAASSQPLAPEAFKLDNWDASGLGVVAEGAAGPTGASSLFALTPSADSVAHALTLAVPLSDGPAVLSFFARPESASRLRAEVVGVASATFDLTAPSVLEQTGTRVTTAEAWGDGLVRLSFAFDVDPGPGQLRLAILSDDGAPVFAGDGAVAAALGDVELRFRSYSTPLPTFGAIQRADHLVYPAGNGNFPPGPGFALSAEFWLPAGPLLADAALLNANFATRYEQQINLFVNSQQGSVQFWGLQDKATPWQLSSRAAVTDGKLHRAVAAVSQGQATLEVDASRVSTAAGAFDVSVLDRVEIGTSTSSSGPLTGIVRRIQIAPQLK